MQTESIKIEGMACNHCVMAVTEELKKLSLESYHVEIGKAEVQYDSSKTTKEDIFIAIEKAGYKIKE